MTQTPYHGIGAIISRNTEKDTPTQRLGGIRPLSGASITSAIVGTGIPTEIPAYWHGGRAGEHSQHWEDYFSLGNRLKSPMGDYFGTPAPSVGTMVAVSDAQHMVTGGSHDVWWNLQQMVYGAMRKRSTTDGSYT